MHIHMYAKLIRYSHVINNSVKSDIEAVIYVYICICIYVCVYM
jgi:hypothetical protein